MSANDYYSGGGGGHHQNQYGGQGYGQPQQVGHVPSSISHVQASRVSQDLS